MILDGKQKFIRNGFDGRFLIAKRPWIRSCWKQGEKLGNDSLNCCRGSMYTEDPFGMFESSAKALVGG
uniref:Uncharacterized protein n=1 Tax=Chromera velia CCMP2878 TaxID=1169474 RepID=A0A0G4H1X8_9ALVE|eukprot:Cvel_24290.t1-p1 / transcript=Cvel_24290.t1 / gene=Cvel_24290 / organism=Chromera_velia_CCMP2878 / gene_product=hypothetical protein / transcript_product=hypothetical protein / location=Cvel_scaffold2606:15905-17419(+) / protein_length=67 / sequence_SO=supercontig / SO=protein_coding / is_pseudo=false